MTKKESLEWIANNKSIIKEVKRGYCCYQEDKVSKWDLLEIGFNRGGYGWNWTMYYNPKTQIVYFDSYRNTPNFEKIMK